MCLFPKTAITNYQKVGMFCRSQKQWKIVLSQFWKPGVQDQDGRASSFSGCGGGASRPLTELQSPGTPWLCQFRKNCTMWELWVKLYLGWDEDCSLGDSTSESSEKLLKRGWGRGRSIYMRFWWRGSSCYQALIFAKKFSVSHKELMSPQRDVVLC